MPGRSSPSARCRCCDDDDVDTLHERIKVAERSLLVEVVTAMTTAPYRVEGRKVRLG